MAAPGAGPSRRSHTKSRKGCKTCKRRHIRCDENFPQCRNCTKHQVRCDYMDSGASASDASAGSSPVAELPWTPEIESLVEHWQRTGVCTVGNFSIDLNAQGHTYSRNDLHLIYHALSYGNSEQSRNFTVWTDKIPKFLQAANAQPFLVHAVLAFASLVLAWEKNSHEAKNLAYHHGGIALQGLQNAISTFSKDNSDAVLAASILLSWQANDWRSWASLITGIRTVVDSMKGWKDESHLTDMIEEAEMSIPSDFTNFARSPPSADQLRRYTITLQQIHASIETLQHYLYGRVQDSEAVAQLKDYVERLLAVRPAHSPEEQFNHLYAFRKWLFWIPSALLRSESRDFMTVIVIAHFYAASLQLEPLFPNVAAPFSSMMSMTPLEKIVEAIEAYQHAHESAGHNDGMITLLQFPKQALQAFHSRHYHEGSQQPNVHISGPTHDIGMSLDLSRSMGGPYTVPGAHPSPAFGPSGPHPMSGGSISSSTGSAYLDVPSLTAEPAPVGSGDDYVVQRGSRMSLPVLPSNYGVDHTMGYADEEDLADYGIHGGE